MSDIEYFLFGALFGLSVKVFIALIEAMAAQFGKDKVEIKNDSN